MSTQVILAGDAPATAATAEAAATAATAAATAAATGAAELLKIAKDRHEELNKKSYIHNEHAKHMKEKRDDLDARDLALCEEIGKVKYREEAVKSKEAALQMRESQLNRRQSQLDARRAALASIEATLKKRESDQKEATETLSRRAAIVVRKELEMNNRQKLEEQTRDQAPDAILAAHRAALVAQEAKLTAREEAVKKREDAIMLVDGSTEVIYVDDSQVTVDPPAKRPKHVTIKLKGAEGEDFSDEVEVEAESVAHKIAKMCGGYGNESKALNPILGKRTSESAGL